jgi:hypothetical protein
MQADHPQALVYLHQSLASRPTGIMDVVEAVALITAAAVLSSWMKMEQLMLDCSL